MHMNSVLDRVTQVGLGLRTTKLRIRRLGGQGYKLHIRNKSFET